jgi:hypothetical protein
MSTPATRSAPNPAVRHPASAPPGTRRSPPLSPAGGPGVRALSDGRLWLLRDAYAVQTDRAPRHTGKGLRLARRGAFDASLGAIRAAAEAQAARKTGAHDRAACHEHLAASYRALRDHYQQNEQALAQAMASRQEWEHATARSGQLAIAADAELRRRHPDRTIEPLRSAEPAPASDAERQHRDLIPQQRSRESTRSRDLNGQRQPFHAAVNEHRSLAAGEDAARDGPGSASPNLQPPWRDAILRPPAPLITPPAEILQRAAERDIEPEAGG